jgi:hypothetical protein
MASALATGPPVFFALQATFLIALMIEPLAKEVKKKRRSGLRA